MVQLRTQRAALSLYGILLVLPTLVLGGLQWHQIVADKQAELSAVPRGAADAALRFENAVRAELDKLVLSEEQRPFQHYARFLYSAPAGDNPPQLSGTPLSEEHRPRGLVAWFSFDLPEALYGGDPEVEFFWGDGSSERALREAELSGATRTLIAENVADGRLRRATRLGDIDRRALPLRELAASQARAEDRECLAAEPEILLDREVEVTQSLFHLQLFESPPGKPRLVATRRVLVDEQPDLRGLTPCLHRLSGGLGLMQGFFIDPQWLFGELPRRVAQSVLDPSQRFVAPDENCCAGGTEVHAEIPLFQALSIEARTALPPDLGTFRVAVDTGDIESRFKARVWRFLGVALMLLISLSTGMVLLLRSVKKDLEQAERTENFVAAVTHELRTPLASIKLHGEMLLDGWTSGPEQKQEYYRRIVRETARLSMLVERVLEKARLSAGATRPYAGDLSRLIAALEPELRDGGTAGGADLAFELAPGLPRVLLTPEAVASILVNLVENARKYAPVDVSRPGAEPIRIVTRPAGNGAGGVALEVLDRGPGIPLEERRRIFEAFYRMGDEATRTSRGTGLGLHLVQLHAQSIGASVSADGRPEGGAAFRVTFAAAPGTSADEV